MKRYVVILILTVTVFLSTTYSVRADSAETLKNDILASLLYPKISKAIRDNYGTNDISYDLFDMKIINIMRPFGFRTFSFIVTVEVTPFTGAHNHVGKDIITLLVTPFNVKVTDFLHSEIQKEPDLLKQALFVYISLYSFTAT